MKKVFSILLALALLAIAGYAMAEPQPIVIPLQHQACWNPEAPVDQIYVAPTCTSTGLALHPYAPDMSDPTYDHTPGKLEEFGNIDITDDMSVVIVGQQKFWTYILPMIPHDFEYYADGVADCNGCYTVTEHCKNCDATGKTFQIFNDDHHVWGAWHVMKAPTCKEPGRRYHICFHCNLRAWEDMDPIPHSYTKKVVDKAPDCIETGSAHLVCEWCDEKLIINGAQVDIELPALGHQISLDHFVVVDEPWCLDEAKWHAAYDEARALGYDEWDARKYANARCGKEGWGFYPCVRVGADKEACCQDLVANKKDGIDCAVPASDIYTLANGDKYVIAVEMTIPALAHDWFKVEEGYIPALCEQDAQDLWMCDRCAHKGEFTVKADCKGDTWNNIVELRDGAPALGHLWGEWVEMNPYEEGVTLGYWVRECEREVTIKHAGTKPEVWHCPANIDYVGSNPHNGEAEKFGSLMIIDGKWALTKKDGSVNVDFSGLYDFEGGKFLVVDGYVADKNGLWLNPDTNEFIYLANGQVQNSYEGLVLYDGAWFFIANGKVATNVCGLKPYDGAEFVVANGQVLTNLNGLWLDVHTNNWYYIAAGKKAPYTGLALYDGAWFYVTNGQLDTTFCGEVEYDGATFTVVNGMLAL